MITNFRKIYNKINNNSVNTQYDRNYLIYFHIIDIKSIIFNYKCKLKRKFYFSSNYTKLYHNKHLQ